jgi:hypothetical protein
MNISGTGLSNKVPGKDNTSGKVKCGKDLHSSESCKRFVSGIKFYYWFCFLKITQGNRWPENKPFYLGHGRVIIAIHYISL